MWLKDAQSEEVSGPQGKLQFVIFFGMLLALSYKHFNQVTVSYLSFEICLVTRLSFVITAGLFEI